MNVEKSQAYKKLVADMQKQYPEYGVKPLANLEIVVGQKGNSAAKKVVQDFAATFQSKQDFYDTLTEFGLHWMQVNNPAIYDMRAKEALRIAIENGFNPFDVVTKKDPPVELFAPVVNGEHICQEINLYTYWQGFGYAEKTPKIKYLLVAQDWGNLFRATPQYFQELKIMNETGKWISYETIPQGNGTNDNLFRLFAVLNRDLLKLNEDVFFTNFCLGYRSGKEVGGMTKKLMMHDADLFKRLCEILEPENILCLGKLTSECAYEALSGAGTWKKIYGGFKSYNDFIENHDELTVNCGNSTARFFPLAHCGYMGTMTRSKNLPKQTDRLFYQKQDWKKIIGSDDCDNKPKVTSVTAFARKYLSNKLLTKKLFDDVKFIHTSASGAMGDPGVLEVWTKNFEHYYCRWIDSSFDVKKFEKAFMKDEDTPYFDNPVKNGWCFHYMGCGNNFYIKEELNDAYLQKFDEGQKNGAGYPFDEDVFPVEEIMLELFNEPPADNFVSFEDEFFQQTQHMESVINKFELKDNIQIYRRADISLLKDFEKILQVGRIFQDDGFTSCTTLEIGSTEDEIEIVVIVPKGKGHGAYIAPLSDFPEECEFVLNRGTIFKVRGIEEYEPKNFRVVIEVIGRSPEELF